MKCQESDLLVCARTLFGAEPCPAGTCSLEEYAQRKAERLTETQKAGTCTCTCKPCKAGIHRARHSPDCNILTVRKPQTGGA